MRTAADVPSYTRPSLSSMSHQPQMSPISTHPPHHRTEASIPQQSPTYPYQHAYSYPPTTPGVTSYQTPMFDNRVNGTSSDQERAEEIRKAIPKESPPNRHAYGEYVKRHLDIFDLETSLNEVNETTLEKSFLIAKFHTDRRRQWSRTRIRASLRYSCPSHSSIRTTPWIPPNARRLRRYD